MGRQGLLGSIEIDDPSKNHGGEAVIFKLKKTSSYSPQPEWCVTQGGEKWDGKGPACLKTDKPKSMNQLRFKVKFNTKILRIIYQRNIRFKFCSI